MKKFVSLLLTICMCISAIAVFTSCNNDKNHEHAYKAEWSYDATHHWHACEGCTDISGKAEHTWNDGEITTEATANADGVKTFTCTVCGKTKTEPIGFTVNATVTKEEWENAFEELVYGSFAITLDGRHPETTDSRSTWFTTHIVTPTAQKIEGVINGTEGLYYVIAKNDFIYNCYYNAGSDSWDKVEVSEYSQENWLDTYNLATKESGNVIIDEIFYPYKLKYDSFSYDENTDSYLCEEISLFDGLNNNNDKYTDIVVSFANGKIQNISCTFFDISSEDGVTAKFSITVSCAQEDTAITLPDFNISEIRKTVTKDEWIFNFTSDNYTINCTEYIGENTNNIIFKVTETAVLESINNHDDYGVLKDGIWYSVEYTDGGYVGRVVHYSVVDPIGDEIFGTSDITALGNIYDTLTYNEAEKFYFVTDDYEEYRIYFENGNIIKIRIDGTRIDGTNYYRIMTVSDIGTTTIEIPDFEIYTENNLNEVTMEEWNSIFSTTNFLNVTVDYTYTNFDTSYEAQIKLADGEIYLDDVWQEAIGFLQGSLGTTNSPAALGDKFSQFTYDEAEGCYRGSYFVPVEGAGIDLDCEIQFENGILKAMSLTYESKSFCFSYSDFSTTKAPTIQNKQEWSVFYYDTRDDGFFTVLYNKDGLPCEVYYEDAFTGERYGDRELRFSIEYTSDNLISSIITRSYYYELTYDAAGTSAYGVAYLSDTVKKTENGKSLVLTYNDSKQLATINIYTATGGLTQFCMNEQGRVERLIDQEDVNLYEYDEAGRLISCTILDLSDEDGVAEIVELSYSGDNTLPTSYTHSLNGVVDYAGSDITYNENAQILTSTLTYYEDGVVDYIDSQISRFNDDGKLVVLQNKGGNAEKFESRDWSYTEWVYDGNGMLIEEIDFIKDGDNKLLEYKKQSEYDANGNCIKITYSYFEEDGITVASTSSISYTYDTNNLCTSKTYSDGEGYRYTYDTNGFLIREVGINENGEETDPITYTWSFDDNGKLIEWTDSYGSSKAFSYDSNGRMSSYSSFDSDGSGTVYTFTYDINGRISQIDITIKRRNWDNDLPEIYTTYTGTCTYNYYKDGTLLSASLFEWDYNIGEYVNNVYDYTTI